MFLLPLGERVIRTKVNSVGCIPRRLSPPLDYTRFAGARNRGSDRRRVKGSKEDAQREEKEKESTRWREGGEEKLYTRLV